MVATDLRDTNGWISSHDPLTVIPLTDSVIDQLGHDVRSSYVETYWLPDPRTIGHLGRPPARRVAREPVPRGVEAPLEPLARSLGLGGGIARHAPIVRTLVRLVDFGLASIGGSTTASGRPSRRYRLDTSPGCPRTWSAAISSSSRRPDERSARHRSDRGGAGRLGKPSRPSRTTLRVRGAAHGAVRTCLHRRLHGPLHRRLHHSTGSPSSASEADRARARSPRRLR